MDQRLSDAQLQQALDACAAEPVHIPGIVQPFGFLLAFDPQDGVISYVSENCPALFGAPPGDILGAAAQDVLGHEIWHELRNLFSTGAVSGQNPPVFIGDIAGTPCAVAAFESQGLHVVEMEKAGDEPLGGTEALRSMSFLMAKVHECDAQQQLMDLTVDLMRHFTGYDRVMIYKFDQEFNGEVIAETRRSSMPSFAGLRFPHWDIPAQARAIMKRVPLRMIEHVDQEPVALLAANAALPPLDITLATCRGVATVHMEYLRNLGCQATMTLNIVVEDQLWGIISLHNRSPKVPSAQLREVLKNFVPVFAAKLLALRNKETLDRIKRLDDSIVSGTDRDFRMEKLLPEIAPVILEVIGADGISALGDAKTSSYGMSPGPELLNELLAYSRGLSEDVVAIENLADTFPALAAFTNGCSGVLIASILPENAICIFRRAVTQEVAWAGKPDKLITEVDGQSRLSPRGSFSVYMQNIKGRSKAWSADDKYFIAHARTLLHASERQTLMNTMNRQQSLMIDELNHRVRNILALVRSVSRQARRRYGSLDSYAAAMESRIRALASSHELSAGSLISPVSIKSLISKEFEPFSSIAEERIVLDGLDRNIRAEIAPIFSLVVHELVTNTVKYGALTSDTGRVQITLEHKQDAMQITWKESGGPPVGKPGDTGFGTAMIEQAVPHELGGNAQFIFEPSGVKAVFTLPDRHFDDVSEPHQITHSISPDLEAPPTFSAKATAGPVLLLEDNYIIAKEMGDQMREFGFGDVETFSNASDALTFLRFETPALAVLDVNLGNKATSIPVALALREKGLPFFFVTGYGENAGLPEELRETPLLTKPVSNREIQDQLIRLLT